MHLGWDAAGKLPAGPAEKGRRVEAEHMGEHFAPKFANNAQLELGCGVCTGGL
jgi:hypothetical protein